MELYTAESYFLQIYGQASDNVAIIFDGRYFFYLLQNIFTGKELCEALYLA